MGNTSPHTAAPTVLPACCGHVQSACVAYVQISLHGVKVEGRIQFPDIPSKGWSEATEKTLIFKSEERNIRRDTSRLIFLSPASSFSWSMFYAFAGFIAKNEAQLNRNNVPKTIKRKMCISSCTSIFKYMPLKCPFWLVPIRLSGYRAFEAEKRIMMLPSWKYPPSASINRPISRLLLDTLRRCLSGSQSHRSFTFAHFSLFKPFF